MFLVAEKHVIRQAIDAPPLDGLVLLMQPGQALNRCALFLNCAMASHTLRSFGNCREVPWFGHRVAAFAVESLGNVHAMAERDRLFRSRRDIFFVLPETYRGRDRN